MRYNTGRVECGAHLAVVAGPAVGCVRDFKVEQALGDPGKGVERKSPGKPEVGKHG